jgi:hypothetical protein
MTAVYLPYLALWINQTIHLHPSEIARSTAQKHHCRKDDSDVEAGRTQRTRMKRYRAVSAITAVSSYPL